jgi:hypothetical protein
MWGCACFGQCSNPQLSRGFEIGELFVEISQDTFTFPPNTLAGLNPVGLLWNVLAKWIKFIPCMENGNHSHQVLDAASRLKMLLLMRT